MEEAAKNRNNHKRKIGALILFTVIVIIGLITVYVYVQYKKTHITTDDAFVDGNVPTVASKVPGTVRAVYVLSNQYVKKGDILLEIDPVDYEVRVKGSKAELDKERAKLLEKESTIQTARDQMNELRAGVDTSKANLAVKEANLKQAEIDIKRAENLFKKDAVSKERYEKTMTAHKVAVAEKKAAEEQLKQAESAIETQKAIIKQAESSRNAQESAVKQKGAELEASRLNYGYTKIYSPSDGFVTKKAVEAGNQIQAGQPLMAIVPIGGLYVTANYKETQLENVKPGQKAEIKIDTYSGKVFVGKVNSIMAGTGSVFSLFPPENATGNYVKVVQRIPVKIVFDKDTDPEHILRMGMSVEPTIIIESK